MENITQLSHPHLPTTTCHHFHRRKILYLWSWIPPFSASSISHQFLPSTSPQKQIERQNHRTCSHPHLHPNSSSQLIFHQLAARPVRSAPAVGKALGECPGQDASYDALHRRLDATEGRDQDQAAHLVGWNMPGTKLEGIWGYGDMAYNMIIYNVVSWLVWGPP